MPSTATTPLEYMNSLPVDRKKPMEELRKVIKKNLSKEYSESIGYGMFWKFFYKPIQYFFITINTEVMDGDEIFL